MPHRKFDSNIFQQYIVRVSRAKNLLTTLTRNEDYTMSAQKPVQSNAAKAVKTAASLVGIGIVGFALGAGIGLLIQKTLNK